MIIKYSTQKQFMHQLVTRETKETKMEPKQIKFVSSQFQQNNQVVLDVHTNQQIKAQKNSRKDTVITVTSHGDLPQTVFVMLCFSVPVYFFAKPFFFFSKAPHPIISSSLKLSFPIYLKSSPLTHSTVPYLILCHPLRTNSISTTTMARWWCVIGHASMHVAPKEADPTLNHAANKVLQKKKKKKDLSQNEGLQLHL